MSLPLLLCYTAFLIKITSIPTDLKWGWTCGSMTAMTLSASSSGYRSDDPMKSGVLLPSSLIATSEAGRYVSMSFSIMLSTPLFFLGGVAACPPYTTGGTGLSRSGPKKIFRALAEMTGLLPHEKIFWVAFTDRFPPVYPSSQGEGVKPSPRPFGGGKAGRVSLFLAFLFDTP